MKNKLNIIIKIVIGVLILAVILCVVWYFFIRNSQLQKSDFQYINFFNNYSVDIPNNFLADDFSNSNAVVFYENGITVNANDLKDILSNKAILIQFFAPLDKNNEFFEKYIRQQYKSNDNVDVDISFEKKGKVDIATLKIKNKSADELNEYMKIINLENPIVIDASEDSETLDMMSNSASNINYDKNIIAIKNKLVSIGTLLKAKMDSDIYSLFTEDYKDQISDSKFSENLKNSQGMLEQQMSLNGGILDKKNNEFTCKIIFANPFQNDKNFLGKIKLKKVKGQWQIIDIDLPKDELLIQSSQAQNTLSEESNQK